MRHLATIGMVAIGLALGHVSNVRADFIPYPNIGHENPVTYTFTAANTGDIIAYFAGSGAYFHNDLGMEVNGVLTANGFGLENHSSAIGASFNLGHANAGDTLIFVLRNLSSFPPSTPPFGNLYSDPTLNAPYDSFYHPSASHNHVYATPYTQTVPIYDSIPVGTYVAFEDLPASYPPDWNYWDESFVFTNVATTSFTMPLPGAAWSGIILLGGMIGRCVLRRRPA